MSIKRILASILMLGAPSAFAQESAPKDGGTAVFAIPGDPSTLLRNLSSLPVDGAVGCIMSQALMESDREGNPVPLLAKSVDVSPDAKTYRFTLQDATWHDGKPLTSEDVRFTLKEVSGKNNAIFRRALAVIESIETPSDKEVVITLKQPYGPLLSSLTCIQGTGILPAHVFAGTDVASNPAAQQPIGTGPFMFKEWVRGSHLTMVRNPNYWEPGKPHLDELIAQIIPTSAGRAQALLSGSIDRIPWMAMEISNYPLIESNPNTELMPTFLPPGMNWIFFNLEREPLSDKRVRQALLMATDRDYIRQAAFSNIGDVGTMPFPASLAWAADESIDYRTMYPFDVERANALLDEAGIARGADGTRFSINFVYRNNFGGGAETAAALRSMWQKVGVELNILSLEAAPSTQRVYMDADFDLFFTGYSSQGHPALGIARAFNTASIGLPNGNAARYSNPTVDALFEEAERAPTQEQSGEIYRQIQRILAEDLPVLSITEQKHFDAQSTSLKGLENEYNHAHWRNAWLDR